MAMVLTAACQPRPTHHSGTIHGQVIAGAITYDADPNDRYDISAPIAGQVVVSAPTTNSDGNVRLALVDMDTPPSIDQSACVTWQGPDDESIQPGVVLRARIDKYRTRSIMVTNNIWYSARHNLNVHVTDTNWSHGYEPVGSISVAKGLGVLPDRKPLPWRICAQALGNTVRAKAWSIPSMAEPSWNDPAFAGSVTLPDSAPRSGVPGVYIAHLAPGESTELTAIETSPITGTLGHQRWEQGQLWAQTVLIATEASTPTQAAIDALATYAVDGVAAKGLAIASVTGTSRVRAANDIYQVLTGRQAPVGVTAPANAADGLAGRALAGLSIAGQQEWVNEVFARVLGRSPAPSDAAYWASRVGPDGRQRVARSIFRTSESQRRLADRAIFEVLHRPATSSERDALASRVVALGFDPVRLRVEVLKGS